MAKLISRRFKGYEMARLVDAVLTAQGYSTFVSPPGAGQGRRHSRCTGRARVRPPAHLRSSQIAGLARRLPTLQQLIGSMQNVQAG